MRNQDSYRKGVTLRTCARCDIVGYSNHIKRQYDGMYVCDRTLNNCLEKRPKIEMMRVQRINNRALTFVRPPIDHGFHCFTPCVADLMIPDCTTCDVFGVPNG